MKIERKMYHLNAEENVAFDRISIKATTTIATNDKSNVEKQTV